LSERVIKLDFAYYTCTLVESYPVIFSSTMSGNMTRVMGLCGSQPIKPNLEESVL
jgi:hypothetical protein